MTGRRQARGLLWFAIALAAAALAMVALALVTPDPLRVWLVAVVAAGASGLNFVRYRRASHDRTECTSDGIRSRQLGTYRRYPWAQISDIEVQTRQRSGTTTSVVAVTLTGGDVIDLPAPVDGGGVRDPDFAAKAERIRAYWRAASDRS